MEKVEFYDGTKILSMKDINGKTPSIFIIVSNRTAGKTTWFNRYLVKKFLEKGEKFMLVYRWKNELNDISVKFFKDIQELFFPNCEMTEKKFCKGNFIELFINNKSCGYAVSINRADQVKKYSHYFSDVERILMDEFQSEDNRYCPNEITKFISIKTSVSRGKGKQQRYVPVYMLANPYSMINPYYMELGISDRLYKNTKFLRGDGYVFEQNLNESAAKAMEEDGFMRAFRNNTAYDYTVNGSYMIDDDAFIEKIHEKNTYRATIKSDGNCYCIRSLDLSGYIYIDDNINMQFPTKISATEVDHGEGFVLKYQYKTFIDLLKIRFEYGQIRFKNKRCKTAFFNLIRYTR